MMDWGSSPHTRGAHFLELHPVERIRIIPAYAGSTPPSVTPGTCSADHPRIRGEHVVALAGLLRGGGSSPHTRGAPRLGKPHDNHSRIIPAYAGSTDSKECPSIPIRDHPRIRGEHASDAQMEAFSAGSSPHTRGAPAQRQQAPNPRRIIPAYAGSTSSPTPAKRTAGDHPRIRGEHPGIGTTGTPYRGSSPHTRGAR